MENKLVDYSKAFAIDIVNVCTEISNDRNISVLANQLLKSGTSIGANIHEGNYAASLADFINKFQIALKECYETEYWLEILKASGFLTEEKFKNLIMQCSRLRTLLTASIKTAKK